MNLSLRELNELIYCIDVARKYGQLLGTTVADTLAVRLRDELDKRLVIDDDGNYLTIPSKKDIKRSDDSVLQNFIAALQQDEERYRNSHFVNNEEADEDASLHMLTSFPIIEPFKPKGVTQAILDMVQRQGDATHTEMHNFYKRTFGSNSFSHILRSLIVPYKNRPTRRYLSKMANGNYEVKVAQLHNWIVKD